MEIKTVSIIGLGALGILFGSQLKDKMEPGNLRIIADKERIEKYKKHQIFCNGSPCSFHYIADDEPCEPADLAIFCVKFNALEQAVESMKHQIGPDTVILSALNGITSEQVLENAFGKEKVLYAVAQGMDAVKLGNQLNYTANGVLIIGEKNTNAGSEKVKRVSSFFDKTGFPYELEENMHRKLWSKFMLNVGVNQTVAIYKGTYGTVQQEGQARETMIAAMKEVKELAGYENVKLLDEDIDYWMKVLDTLGENGMPSMRQDVETRSYSEVELFSGTVIALGKKHGMPTPVNDMLYKKIKEIESKYK